ncbi:hypothetical protein [Pseudomonas aeruginosa]|uniref:hypothetical protein n=1 Tax=Pseudomonas aeruginosa TaxID=287 RepID=UPI001E54BE9C|nr:hypothetical protein [Pseudomonas aeruginosa]MCC9290250.1 hypothetical protein [Pseudomonas aeruginosa]
MNKPITCWVDFHLKVGTGFRASAAIYNNGSSAGGSIETSWSIVDVPSVAAPARGSRPNVRVVSGSRQPVRVVSSPDYLPFTRPAASVLPAPISDDAEVRRYDRYPNESDVDYIARMKQVYKTSAAELERVGAEHMLRMQQLAPH